MTIREVKDLNEVSNFSYGNLFRPFSPFFVWTSFRLISRAWEVAGTRYDNSKLAKQSSSKLFSGEADAKLLEFWHCRTNGGII